MTTMSSRSVVAVAHVMPADVRNHLRALADAGLLRQLFTGYVYQPDRWLERCGRGCDRFLGTRIMRLLATRPEVLGVDSSDIVRVLLPEAARFVSDSLPGSRSRWLNMCDRAQQRLSIVAAGRLRGTDRLVLAREFEAREVFERAATLGIPRVYQLPIAHYRMVDRVLRRELEEYRDADFKVDLRVSAAPQRNERKQRELELANRIVVPSLFVKKSLIDAGVSEDKIYVLPFGTEEEWIVDSVSPKDSRLFLHVGQLSMRKGTHRLLRAWKRLGAHRACELRLIGSMRLPPALLADFQGTYNYLGRLARPLLREHFSAASCSVLPTLAEGFALVILESLSCGTPIVASRNCGAEGFIQEGREGLLHDAQDDEQLCEALEWMLTNPQRRAEMSHDCLKKARSWTWREYRSAFLKLVESGSLSQETSALVPAAAGFTGSE